ncbi:MAG TPA: L,D-transpeptidase [Gemmatimonadaceae bacterium]
MTNSRLPRMNVVLLALVALLGAGCRSAAGAQGPGERDGSWLSVRPDDPRAGIRTPRAAAATDDETRKRFTSPRDSLNWVAAQRVAEKSKGFRVVVSLFDRTVWVLDGEDTLRIAAAAVAKDSVLEYAGKRWVFKTPRGIRTVRAKEADPVWTPPEWHYAEVARDYGLKVKQMPAGGVAISDGRKLLVRDSLVGVWDKENGWAPLPLDEEIVFDNTLFIPPASSRNRRLEGELGLYKLDLGDGYLLHGTPHKGSIGRAVTHGCVRLADEDIAWLFEHVPVGTKVYIY